MTYLVVNWCWSILYSGDTLEECEDWMRENPNPGTSYAVVIQRKVILS